MRVELSLIFKANTYHCLLSLYPVMSWHCVAFIVRDICFNQCGSYLDGRFGTILCLMIFLAGLSSWCDMYLSWPIYCCALSVEWYCDGHLYIHVSIAKWSLIGRILCTTAVFMWGTLFSELYWHIGYRSQSLLELSWLLYSDGLSVYLFIEGRF